MVKVVVIGAGASGMMCAAIAAKNGADVLLLERNDRCGRKLGITGKGRCNVTNACSRDEFLKNVVNNPRFLYSALSAFSTEDTVSFFESLGVPLKVERGNRVFPVSDKASDIVSALRGCCIETGVKLQKGLVTEILTQDSAVVGVRLSDGVVISCDKVCIACGGMSYPVTGSDGNGYSLAEACGHEVVSPRPSLVPWETEELEFCRSLQGLSLKNTALRVEQNGKTVFSDFGEMMFTHFGVTGPMILTASTVLQRGMKLHLDLKPALTEEQLDKRLLSDFEKYRMKNLANAFDDLLPSKLILPFLSLCGLDPTAKVHSITKEQRKTILRNLKDLTLTARSSRSIAEAIVTAGGVKVSKVDPRTMASKLCRGLYFCGEVLDVDAYTGGFNLQIAFSTGYLAGLALAESR
ncbi:MAG: NAD(P)/FAD-dependent oxidoreductase [Clostridia bacterium]|nr:NAD(P)/FAD-dependent oxidoreductase [Clostridia bacterium]